MSVLLDALRPRTLPGLIGVAGPKVDGLFNALTIGSYTPTAVPPALRFDFGDPDVVATYYAGDASRFASASIETMLAAENGCVRWNAPTAWQVIQLYYSAFYAAHAVLRIVGCSCTYLSPSAAARVSRVLTTVGIAAPFPMSGGLYGCQAGPTGDLTIVPLGGGASGGSHELFWQRFVQEIDVLSAAILAGPLPASDRLTAAARLFELRDTLSAGAGTGDWLSRMRNEIQYRQGMGVWFPARLEAKQAQRLESVIKSWTAAEPAHTFTRGTRAGELLEFASACVFMIAVCRGLVLGLAERAPRRGRSFVDHGPAKLLRQHQRC